MIKKFSELSVGDIFKHESEAYRKIPPIQVDEEIRNASSKKNEAWKFFEADTEIDHIGHEDYEVDRVRQGQQIVWVVQE